MQGVCVCVLYGHMFCSSNALAALSMPGASYLSVPVCVAIGELKDPSRQTAARVQLLLSLSMERSVLHAGIPLGRSVCLVSAFTEKESHLPPGYTVVSWSPAEGGCSFL